VVNGKRLIQSATDIFVGWTSLDGMDFYVRQFRDMKVVPDATRIAPVLGEFATPCCAVLARAHARTGDAVAIASYIGKGKRFDASISRFARTYADQTERDHAQLVTAIADGTVRAEDG
jgi:predicted alpha/beta hydrolase